MNDRKALFLFDIDGTLILPGKTARRLFVEIIEQLTGKHTPLEFKHVAGFTDPKIVGEMLQRSGVSDDSVDQIKSSFFPKYFERMKLEYPVADDKIVYPEVQEMLEELRDSNNVYLGLVTGNMETTARIKLEPFGLNDFFSLGAFASDHPERNNLPPIAVARAEEKWNVKFSQDEVFVIGDTIHDVICAQVNGYIPIGIARRDDAISEFESVKATNVFREIPPAIMLKKLASLE